jgi:hypothetical protein
MLYMRVWKISTATRYLQCILHAMMNAIACYSDMGASFGFIGRKTIFIKYTPKAQAQLS